MKVITKCVVLENEKFVLIKDKNEMPTEASNYQNGEYYGTIPYSELDEQGRMKRALNGFEMCIQNSPYEAIRQRLISVKLLQYKKDNPIITDLELSRKVMELFNTIK